MSCALDAQRAFARHNTAAGEDRQILVRMGVHAGEVAVSPDGDLLGLTVNVAASLEQEAPMGGVCVSDLVLGMVRRKVSAAVEPLGVRELKGVGPSELHALSPADEWSE
ncbi:MAG: adenylate/guanylate cyclase domain-containing protein [bacterium]|nr:adenylate/guanylate cyclase domain-containing protein [bacterium]